MLCGPCTSIWEIARKPPGTWIGIKPALFEYPQSPNAWFGPHHIELGSFLSAQNDRCYVCCTIFRDLSPQLRDQARFFRTFYQLTLSKYKDKNKQAHDQYELEFTIEVLHSQDPPVKRQVMECSGIFKIIPKDELRPPCKAIVLAEDTFSDECKRQVKMWLNHCVSLHDVCNRDSGKGECYPARLLKFDATTFQLVLFESGLSLPSYVTLSHCWEAEMSFKLTSDTMADLIKGLPVSKLPRRFWEAMEIARWMEKEYIWIDALCIIQNSKSDWFTQSIMMGDIYAKSYCNIAATISGQNKGCFTKRHTKMVEPYSVRNPRSTSDSKMHVVGYDDFWSNSLLDTRLHTRGWVLQERLLSPRTIHFGQEQIFWECRCQMKCEAYPEGIPEQFRNRKTLNWRRFDKILNPEDSNEIAPSPQPRTIWQTAVAVVSKLFRFAKPGLVITQPLQVYLTWSKIIERYMECRLSYPEDKLIAVAGIAQKIKEVLKQRYLAGLWENEMLPQSLLWYVLGRRQADSTPSVKIGPAYNSIYRAPSWSWASLEAKVVWNWPSDCDKILVDIIETKVEGSKLGRIEWAQMEIQGHIFQAELRIAPNDDGTHEEDGQYELKIRCGESGQDGYVSTDTHPSVMEPIIYLDTQMTSAKDYQDTYLLPICTNWKGLPGGIMTRLAGLLLKRCTPGDPFERIGIFALTEKDTKSLYNVSANSSDCIGKAIKPAQRLLLA